MGAGRVERSVERDGVGASHHRGLGFDVFEQLGKRVGSQSQAFAGLSLPIVWLQRRPLDRMLRFGVDVGLFAKFEILVKE